MVISLLVYLASQTLASSDPLSPGGLAKYGNICS
jgi:hypothetical protein